MAFTIEFLREDKGELKPVGALANEKLDDDTILSILNLRVFDTISLGSGSEKKTYRIQRIERHYQEGDLHIAFVVIEADKE